MRDVDYKKCSSAELRNLVNSFSAGTPQRNGPLEELFQRQYRRDFWMKDIVPWISLLISVVALVISVMKK